MKETPQLSTEEINSLQLLIDERMNKINPLSENSLLNNLISLQQKLELLK